MPLSILPIQSDLDVVSESGDTVLIPQRLFEDWFGNFTGGLLGVRLIGGDAEMYATSAPHSEEEDCVYLPDWMMVVLREKTLQLDGELRIGLAKMEGVLPTIRRIVLRSIEQIRDGVDIREVLERFLYDCHYIQENTVLRPVADAEVWIERLIGSRGEPVAAGILDGEVELEIQGSLESDDEFPEPPDGPIGPTDGPIGPVAEPPDSPIAPPNSLNGPNVPPYPFPAEQREMTRQEIAQLRVQWWQNRIAPFMNASSTEGSQSRP